MMQWGPYSTEDMGENLTCAKHLILAKLLKDGKLSEKDYAYYAKNFAIISAKPSLFSRVWGKLLKGGDGFFFILVEQHNLEDVVDFQKKEAKKDGQKP